MISFKKVFLPSILFAIIFMHVTSLKVMASRQQWTFHNTNNPEQGCRFAYYHNSQYENIRIDGVLHFFHISVCHENSRLTHVTDERTGVHYYPHLEEHPNTWIRLYGGFDSDSVSPNLRASLLDAWHDYATVECRPPSCHDEL